MGRPIRIQLLRTVFSPYFLPMCHPKPALGLPGILQFGWWLVGTLPYFPHWLFIALGLASVFALLLPRKQTAPKLC
jgi:hypothetical protein